MIDSMDKTTTDYWLREYFGHPANKHQSFYLNAQSFFAIAEGDAEETLIAIPQNTLASVSVAKDGLFMQVSLDQIDYTIHISTEYFLSYLTEDERKTFEAELNNFIGDKKMEIDGVVQPTSLAQVYTSKAKGLEYFVKHTAMMTVKTYSYKSIKRGARLIFMDCYMGKKKGVIAQFKNGEEEIVEIPYMELREKLEKGDELQILLTTEPTTDLIDNDGYYDEDELGAWA